MLIKLWGVRGSIPAPLRNAEYRRKIKAILREWMKTPAGTADDAGLEAFIAGLPEDLRNTYGGDTTCLTVQSTPDAQPIVIDCGTGLRVLGDELMFMGPSSKGEGDLKILLTHTHWDHIQGLPFFKPIYIPGNRLEFISPYPNLEERLVGQQTEEYFPMPFHGTASEKSFRQLAPGETLELDDGIRVDCYPLRHPGGSYAYRFRRGQHTFIFATDCEFTGEDMQSTEYDDFFRGADLLVMDAQYTLDESFKKFDWGHTSFTMAVNCAVKWKVKHLILTHHEPAYQDFQIYQNYNDALAHRSAMPASDLKVHAAFEGMTIRLGPLGGG